MTELLIKAAEWMAGVIGAVIVVYMTQIINERIFMPRKELSDIMRKVSYTVRYYSNVITNPGPENIESEAKHDLRDAGMDIKAFLNDYPKCKYRGMKAEELEIIATKLVFLSNSICLKKALDANAKQLDDIRKMLENR